MALLRKFFNQTRKPEGFLGKLMLSGMNSGHAKLADWGFAHLPALTVTAAGERYRAIGRAMEVPYIDSMNDEDAAKATIAAVKKLGADVGIPADLKEIVKDEDVLFLSESAFADACCPGNPRDTSVEEIAALYRSLM
jgi:alcohol dehydrogenase class IV